MKPFIERRAKDIVPGDRFLISVRGDIGVIWKAHSFDIDNEPFVALVFADTIVGMCLPANAVLPIVNPDYEYHHDGKVYDGPQTSVTDGKE